jgi:hypothetical protein
LKTINPNASPPFSSHDQKGLKTLKFYAFLGGADEDGPSGETLELGGAVGLEAESRRCSRGASEVASSSSSMMCAWTDGAEDE